MSIIAKHPIRCPKCGSMTGWKRVAGPKSNPSSTSRIPIGLINERSAQMGKSDAYYHCSKCGFEQRY